MRRLTKKGKPSAPTSPVHAAARAAIERMESRVLLAGGNVVISEIMADNNTGIKDYYGQTSDWVELRNLDSTPADLSGWRLRDGSSDYLLPTRTTIAAGGYLLVFASGRTVVKAPNGELHANFKLASEGEYLGLLRPDLSIASEFAPNYPQQYTDVSYGLANQPITTTLVGPGATGKWLVPTSPAALDPNWFGTGFAASAWTAGVTGLGFDTSAASAGKLAVAEVHGTSPLANVQDAFNLILSGAGTRTDYAATTVNFVDPQNASAGHFTSNVNFGGNTAADDDNVAVRVHGTIHIATAGAYTFGVNSDDGFSLRLAGATFTTLTNASNATGGDTMEFAGARASAADTFGQTTLAAGDYPFELHYFTATGASGVELFAASGAKTAYDTTFRLVGDTANGGLPLLKVADVVGNNPTFKTAAQGVNASAFLRIGFNVADVSNVAGLLLRMKFDDGFVAYLNGQEVARVNAPATTAWNSTATGTQLAGDAVQFQNFDLTDFAGYLLQGNNVLAIQGLNTSAADADFLLLPQLEMTTQSQALSSLRYFVTPTPRAANGAGVADLGPIVTDVSTPATQPGDNDAIVVTAHVRAATNPVAGAPTLFYRVMYNTEQSTPMWDDGPAGGHGDAKAGDGIWTGAIPASASTPGQMVRWYVTASDTLGNQGRWPILVPVVGNDAGPEYQGTVIANGVTSTLPTFWWFTNNTAGANGAGARGSVYFLNEFYDNVFIRDRGANTTNGNKFEFNSGYDFRYATDQPRVNEFNLNQRGAQDPTYVRPVLSFNTFIDAGVPALASFPMRTNLNGTFNNVSDFIGQVNDTMFERFGWYGDGSLYKLVTDVPQMNNASAFEKKNRDQEDRSDLSAFLAGIHLTGTALTKYLYDNVNIPVMLDYIAANVLVNDTDDAQKNYYLYRDTNDGSNPFYDGANDKGTNEWTMIPWDKDLTFGVNFGIAAYAAHDPQTHPFFPDSNHPKIDGAGAWNWLINALLSQPAIKQMYVRRLRTMMDEMLQPPGTPAPDRYYESRLDALFADLTGDPSFAGATLTTLTTAFNDLKTKYLDPRRVHLYVDHSLNTAYPDYAGIPAQQNGSPTITFGQYDATPNSGNQDDEYLTLVNPNSFAVDISDWRLTGGVDYTFKKGTVIPPGGTLYVSPNVFAFRNRPGRSPTAVEFVQGNYGGHLSRLGETVILSDPHGKQIGSLTTTNAPSQAQQSLRVTEIMYHPAPAPAGSGFFDEDFAYIEVKNIGTSTLSLTGVKFTDGVAFDFTASNVQSLAPGGFALVVANLAAFQSRYGHGLDAKIAGVFQPFAGAIDPSGLDNAGEHVRLADAQGETILAFDYKDGWYTQTDGAGNSLVIRSAIADAATWDDRTAWAASAAVNGSPGADDAPAPIAADAIVVNELLSNAIADPHGAWVEFRNTTGAAINIGGWYLSDDAADLKKYRVATGTIIPAGGYIAFNRANQFGNAADPGRLKPMDLSPTGGSIYLTSSDAPAAGNSFSGYQVSQDYNAAAPDVSLGRYTTSINTNDFVPLASSTYGATNTSPAVGPVVISEVMYHPAAAGDEYVELRNTTGAAIDLTGWRLDGGIEFTFPDGASIPASGYVLVVKALPSFFRTKYAVPAAVPIFGRYDNSLNNGDDRVELDRPGTPGADGKTPHYRVDQVRYDDSLPWPVAADGLKASLNRPSLTAYGDDVANWQAGHATPGGAPVPYDASAPSVPANPATQVLSSTQTKITWNASTDPQSAVAFYYVYANGNRIGAATGTSFTDIWVVSGQPARTYQISAVNADGVESPPSGSVLSASMAPVTPDPRTSAVNQITITFTDPVTGFGLSDLKLTRNGGANLLTGAQTLTTIDNITWTLGNLAGLTAPAGNYLLTLTAAGSGIVNGIGTPLAIDSIETWTVDLTAPTVAVTPVTPDPRVTAADQITIVFNEPVTAFDLGDLTLKRDGGPNLLTASQTLSTSDNVTWTLANLGGLTYLAGNYQLTVIAAGITDLAGNTLAAGATESWVMSVTAPNPSDTTDDGLGTVTAQGENGENEGMLKAFDNQPGTKWLDFANDDPANRSSWIQYQYANGLKYIVTQYTITSANDQPERDPANWQLVGSNDGGQTWTPLDTRTGETFDSRFLKQTYSFPNALAYNIYRLNITSVANPSLANSVQLAEIELIGVPPPPPPTVTQPSFGGPTGRALTLHFSGDVHASLAAADLQLRNTTTGQPVTAPTPTYDLATNTATFALTGLPDGNYVATLLAAGVTDATGAPLDGDGNGIGGDNYTYNFYFLAGDANHDRAVDFNDLVVLAQNYNTTGGKTWDQGDFTGDGNVDFNDLVLLAQRYNTSLPVPVAAVPSAAGPAPVPATPKLVSKPVVTLAAPKPVAKPRAKPGPTTKTPAATVLPPSHSVFSTTSIARSKKLYDLLA